MKAITSVPEEVSEGEGEGLLPEGEGEGLQDDLDRIEYLDNLDYLPQSEPELGVPKFRNATNSPDDDGSDFHK